MVLLRNNLPNRFEINLENHNINLTMKHLTEEIQFVNTTVRLKNNTLLRYKESNFV